MGDFMKVFMGKNYSCGVNYQYHEIISKLEEVGGFEFVLRPEYADILIFAGTCSCHAERIMDIIRYIQSAINLKKPEAKTYLTGCLAREFFDSEQFKKVTDWLNSNIDCVVPYNKTEYLFQDLLHEQVNESENQFGIGIFGESELANIYISSGCMHKCSFCKTTYQSIPLISMNISRLKEMIDELDENNIEHLMLRGMNICQFGLDTQREYLLPSIIDYVETKKNIKKLSLLGFAFNDAIHHDFKYCLQKSSKVDILIGSLESGDNRLLQLMNKGFTVQEFLDFVEFISKYYLKKLDTNIIAGYPTETMDDVRRTIQVLDQLVPYLDSVHVCKYKDSPFVPSHSLEQLSKETISEHTRVFSKFLEHKKIPYSIIR